MTGDPIGDLKQRFGENLIVLRNQANLSRKGTAERSGLHTTEIGLLERGGRLPRLDTIVRVAGAIEVEPCELLAGMAWRIGGRTRRGGGYALLGAVGSPLDAEPKSI